MPLARLELQTDAGRLTIGLDGARAVELNAGTMLFIAVNAAVSCVTFFPGLSQPGEFALAAFRARRLPPGLAGVKAFALRVLSAAQNSAPGDALCVACAVVREEGYAGLAGRWGGELAIDIERIKFSQRYYWLWGLMLDRPGWFERSRIARDVRAMAARPLVSLFLDASGATTAQIANTIASLRAQLYPDWELFVCNAGGMQAQIQGAMGGGWSDSRIRSVGADVCDIAQALNAAMSQAKGEFCGLLGAGDEMPVHALYTFAVHISRHPRAKILYADEDRLSARGSRIRPHFKPEWNESLFFGTNYLGRAALCRLGLLRDVGGFRADYTTATFFDLLLRCVDRLQSDEIAHIPHVLFHGGGGTEGSRPAMTERHAAAVQDLFRRRGCCCEAAVQVMPASPSFVRTTFHGPTPAVAIVIPTRNQRGLLAACIESLLAKTDYPNFRILVIDNQSDDPDAIKYLRALSRDKRVEVVAYDRPFNYSAINNFAVTRTDAEIICLLNNDTEIVSGGWLREMVSYAARADVGAVGARLLYKDGALQHAGVIVGSYGVAVHCFQLDPGASPGYFGRAAVTMELSAVTAACLAVRREAFWAAGGLDETGFQVAFNDIDFCLQLRELGLRNIYTPHVEIIHHESRSRGVDDTRAKKARFRGESDLFKRRWARWTRADPAYNPNLSLGRADFALSPRPRAGKPWKQRKAPYAPPNPMAKAADPWQASGLGRRHEQAPEILRSLPARVTDFKSGSSVGAGMILQAVTSDGWRDLGPTSRCRASQVVRLRGWAYQGEGEALQAAYARVGCAGRTMWCEIEAIPSLQVGRFLGRSGAPRCGFDARILRHWLGDGVHVVDLVHVYQTFAVDMRGVIEIDFISAAAE